jgi:hypothetical protein
MNLFLLVRVLKVHSFKWFKQFNSSNLADLEPLNG